MTNIVDTFYAIDFDRCLSNTDKLDDIFYTLIDEYDSIDGDMLRSDRRIVELGGGSFDEVDALQKQLSTTDQVQFFDAFTERCLREDVLLPGAQELIGALKANNKHFGIVSYGGQRWQTIKIQASGVDYIPALIIDHKRKGEIIGTWQQSDKMFVVPASLMPTDKPTVVKAVVLMDDKAGAFSGLPTEARGYWVQSLSKPLLPSQQGTIPDNVRIVHGLGQVTQLESL